MARLPRDVRQSLLESLRGARKIAVMNPADVRLLLKCYDELLAELKDYEADEVARASRG